MISNTTERLLGLFASLATIGGFLWAIINTLDRFQVPFWLSVSTALSCFLLGFLIGKKKKPSNHISKLKRLGQVGFDFLPDSPDKHGWEIVLEPENGATETPLPPEFSISTESPVAGALSISNKDRYFMDFLVDQTQGMAEFIEFYCKYIRSASFYLNVKVTSRDGSQNDSVWLCYLPARERAIQAYKNEWQIPMPGEVLEGGWTAAKISVADDISRTFGKDGWVYRSIQRIRLRGSLDISPITFFKIE